MTTGQEWGGSIISTPELARHPGWLSPLGTGQHVVAIYTH